MSAEKNRNIRRYDNLRIRTSSPKGLICFMHGKVLSLIKRGMETGARRDIEKAQNLIFLLELAVNKKEDASRVLANLYAYCYYLLEKADTQGIITARKIMETLSGAFNLLAKQRVA